MKNRLSPPLSERPTVPTRRLPAAERKQQILMSAIRVFARSTYHGATTKGIAEEAGVTEALLYRYYSSKRDLFIDAIDHTSGKLARGLEHALAEHYEHPVEAIVSCMEFYARLLQSSEDLARMIFLVLAELDEPDVRAVYLPYQEKVVGLLTENITRWQDAGIVDPRINAFDTAWLFYGTYMILALARQSHGRVRVSPRHAVGLMRPFLSEDGERRLDELSQTRPQLRALVERSDAKETTDSPA
ncbi:TetR/AcrR family transcriptional regulator [Lujinxingia vulgaris]|uniref:TetR/AcrR family transcriptional regulator n=1 Tax=Lujinxingia vulgaris TaxID=2600176 RepID=UPI001E2CB9DD|nr:TetR/AcrR family transcriptional regulator [Lujinxingia vulgaris]